MLESAFNLRPIEDRLGVPFSELQTMAAEVSGLTFDPQLLHPEQLALGIGSLGLEEVLADGDIETIISEHTHGLASFKNVFDLPFSTREQEISAQIFETLLPLKHHDQYATDDMALAEFSRTEKDTALAVLGRLGSRRALEVGIRHARKKRGNFHYSKWPTPQERRNYRDNPAVLLGPLKAPFAIKPQ